MKVTENRKEIAKSPNLYNNLKPQISDYRVIWVKKTIWFVILINK